MLNAIAIFLEWHLWLLLRGVLSNIGVPRGDSSVHALRSLSLNFPLLIQLNFLVFCVCMCYASLLVIEILHVCSILLPMNHITVFKLWPHFDPHWPLGCHSWNMSSSGAELPCHLEDSFSVTSRIYCALGGIYDVNVFIYMYQYTHNSVLACKRKLYESIKTGLSRNPYSFR